LLRFAASTQIDQDKKAPACGESRGSYSGTAARGGLAIAAIPVVTVKYVHYVSNAIRDHANVRHAAPGLTAGIDRRQNERAAHLKIMTFSNDKNNDALEFN
jgi:hypothetical protein